MSASKLNLAASVLEALPDELTWSTRPGKADLRPLPGCPAVYLLLTESKVPVQLASTQHLRRLAIARLADPARPERGKADLAAVVRGIRWRRVYSAFEGRWWYYRLAREMYPKHYRRLISFGPAWFLHVDWEQRVPEIRVTEHVWEQAGEHVGPWLTHDTCQKALDGLWSLFDLCRHPEQVRRAPAGQACAYLEMGRCDAPCDGSVPLERYVERCRRAWAFTCGGVQAWVADAKERMRAAAAQQRFETAGQIKEQLAFAWKWHDRWSPTIRPRAELDYLLAVPVTRRRAWKLFLLQQGDLRDGPILTDRQTPGGAEQWLAEQLARVSEPPEPRVRTEQTWLVAHFLSSKEGDATLVQSLRGGEPPTGLGDELRRQITERRAARESEAATSG